MPATWGFGAAGTEPITMVGWGYLTDLAGTEVASAIYSAVEAKTSYRAEKTDTSYSASESGTKYKARSGEE